MTITALVENWWMMAVRGAFALLFGLSLVLWPALTLSGVVVFFAAYAALDGLWALASAIRASEYALDAWPVALEGAASLAIGIIALTWPSVPRDVIWWVAAWGTITGGLEIAAALRLPREVAGHWLLGTGGVCSLFLAVLVVMLPHAGIDWVAALLGAYALLYGALVSLAAFRFRRAHRRRPGRSRRALRVPAGWRAHETRGHTARP